jgi:signal transduction histidine kinase
MLHQEGLLPALRWLSTRASERSGVRFGFRSHATGEPVPQALAIVLFQCARELVYNVAKHAAAQSGLLSIDVNEREIVLTVSDDGRGMPEPGMATSPSAQGGFGLFSIRERLALLGGSLSISSGGDGTRVSIRVPLTAAAAAADGAPGQGAAVRAPAERPLPT